MRRAGAAGLAAPLFVPASALGRSGRTPPRELIRIGPPRRRARSPRRPRDARSRRRRCGDRRDTAGMAPHIVELPVRAPGSAVRSRPAGSADAP
ncbi:MAG: hypothetical protein IPM29_26060 [Planctomycetes bacterium]|nr:hypothetical protein [Planctomycetota bacterium]